MATTQTTTAQPTAAYVDARPARLARQIVLALLLVVAVIAIGTAVVLTSNSQGATTDAPATDAVPEYTGDWKDSVVARSDRQPVEPPAYTGDWKDLIGH